MVDWANKVKMQFLKSITLNIIHTFDWLNSQWPIIELVRSGCVGSTYVDVISLSSSGDTEMNSNSSSFIAILNKVDWTLCQQSTVDYVATYRSPDCVKLGCVWSQLVTNLSPKFSAVCVWQFLSPTKFSILAVQIHNRLFENERKEAYLCDRWRFLWPHRYEGVAGTWPHFRVFRAFASHRWCLREGLPKYDSYYQ